MKKFKLILFSLLVAVGVMSAQPIAQSRFFDETYFRANVGYDWNVDHWHGLGVTNGVAIGKMITPQVGVELDYTMYFQDFYKSINAGRLGMNFLVNLNTLGGYHGHRNLVEVTPFVGLGWQRVYGLTNNMYSNFGFYIDFNTSSAFAISVTPRFNCIMTPSIYSKNTDFGVEVGIKYRFKNHYGTRNFVLCNNKYTQEQMDMIIAKANALHKENEALQAELAKKPQVVTNTVVETVVEQVTTPILPSIGFNCGQSTLLGTNLLNLKDIADYMIASEVSYTITGYASMEGPETFNKTLSLERAQAVRNALLELGVHPENLTVVGNGPTEQFGSDYQYNRVVIITEDE